jgi:hypothetical protein
MKKSFKQYLMESVRSYRYKIKIAGSPEKNWVDMFVLNLQKFDPVKIGEPKSTPIQKDPYGFPGLTNQAIFMIDVEFKYPATEPMVKQLARLLNYDENLVRMIQADYDDSVQTEVQQYENQMSHSPVLDHEELEDAGKQASKDYADQYLTKIAKETEKDKIEMKYAAPKTKAAEDSRKIPGNNKSPMTTIQRQPKPATGATKSRG